MGVGVRVGAGTSAAAAPPLSGRKTRECPGAGAAGTLRGAPRNRRIATHRSTALADRRSPRRRGRTYPRAAALVSRRRRTSLEDHLLGYRLGNGVSCEIAARRLDPAASHRRPWVERHPAPASTTSPRPAPLYPRRRHPAALPAHELATRIANWGR